MMTTTSQARHVEERLLAPCCWRESLAFHRSPEADSARAEVRALLAAGKTEDEVVAVFVRRYGQRILREPEGETALWLRTVPAGVLVTATALVVSYIVRARRRRPAPSPEVKAGAEDVDWL